MKTLILLRHSHRDKHLGVRADNGLSKKGLKQSRELLALYKKLRGKQKALLLSSPKKRCIETLDPLARALKTEIIIDPLLDQGNGLNIRRKSFYRWWVTQAPPLVVACSHGEWIPSFVKEHSGAIILCSKGSWCELEHKERKTALRLLIQEPGTLEL